MKSLRIILLLFLLLTATALQAQKAASSQKENLRAPSNIKIDGKLTEWGNKLQAYSNHTQFYYTISNDNKYLYLTIQAKYHEITTRILKGGITLTINKSGNRGDTNSVQITYPIIKPFIIRFGDAPDAKHGGVAASAKLDTFVNETNINLDSQTKFIRVAGIKGVDTLISVYNLDGIKAASGIDKQLRFNYELAISLQDLGMDINNPQKFNYQVMINETDKLFKSGPHKRGEIYVEVSGPAVDPQPATDFWGEYTLAR